MFPLPKTTTQILFLWPMYAAMNTTLTGRVMNTDILKTKAVPKLGSPFLMRFRHNIFCALARKKGQTER